MDGNKVFKVFGFAAAASATLIGVARLISKITKDSEKDLFTEHPENLGLGIDFMDSFAHTPKISDFPKEDIIYKTEEDLKAEAKAKAAQAAEADQPEEPAPASDEIEVELDFDDADFMETELIKAETEEPEAEEVIEEAEETAEETEPEIEEEEPLKFPGLKKEEPKEEPIIRHPAEEPLPPRPEQEAEDVSGEEEVPVDLDVVVEEELTEQENRRAGRVCTVNIGTAEVSDDPENKSILLVAETIGADPERLVAMTAENGTPMVFEFINGITRNEVTLNNVYFITDGRVMIPPEADKDNVVAFGRSFITDNKALRNFLKNS